MLQQHDEPRRLTFCDDWITVTGQGHPLTLARDLHESDPDRFDFVPGPGTRNYSLSLQAPKGILLRYGVRNGQGLNAEQSDTRDSDGWCLEVPGDPAPATLQWLRRHPFARSMQVSRRDVALTWRPMEPDHVYAMWKEWILIRLRRPATKYGPADADWQACSLYTHPLRLPNPPPRSAILYDKHAESPDEYPDPGTLRLEFRFRPDKAAQKLATFLATPDELLNSWNLSRGFVGILRNETRHKSFRWLAPAPDDDLDRLTLSLLRSYAPTIAKGIARFGRDYLDTLTLAAALLQASPTPPADAAAPGDIAAPQAAEPAPADALARSNMAPG